MTGDPVAFLRYAEANKPAHERRKEEAADRRAEKKAKKTAQQQENEVRELSRAYRHYRKQDIERVLTDEAFGSRMSELRKFLRRVTLSDRDMIIARMSEPWLVHAPFEFRWEALRMASHHIIRARLAAGLPEFDDGMMDEEPGVLHIIKKGLGIT